MAEDSQEYIQPDDVFRIGYYYYQWLRQSHPELLEAIREETDSAPEVELEGDWPEVSTTGMPTEWWARWGRGLLERVYPVMRVIMHPEFVDLWLKGLAERLSEHGVDFLEIE